MMTIYRRTFCFRNGHYRQRCLWLLLLTLCAQPQYSWSNNTDPEDLFSLSLEELINLPALSVTSNQSESYIERPGIVSFITAEDIKTYGANNLLDLLRRLPNIEVPSLYLFRNNISSVRAQHSDATDTRILILLNGRPMRETYNGGVNSAIYDGFPLSSIQWIEVIRGPGSVLHGSGAFSSVINIVTKTASSTPSVDSTVSYGSFGTKILETSAAARWSELDISGGFKLHAMDGWEYAANDASRAEDFTPTPVYDEMDYGQNLWSATFRTAYQNFSLEYFESRNKTDILGTVPEWPEIESDQTRRFINAGYTHNLNQNWKADFNITYNRFDSFTGPENKTGSEDVLFELSLQGGITEELDLIIGGTTENISWYRNSDPKDDGSDNAQRSFAEFIYRPAEGLRLALGAQYNKAPGADSNTSPRAALTYKFLDKWGIKLLYGEAFRAATSLERFADIENTIEGKDDLNAETIKTSDLQVFYYERNLFTALTYYRSTEKDTIALDFSPVDTGGLITYKNGQEIEYHGVEWEFSWFITDNLTTTGSYSYQSNLDENDQQGTKLTPRHMIKAGISYKTDNGISIGLYDSYFDDYTKMSSAVVFNPDSSSYHHMSANLVFNLNKLANYHSEFNSSITLYADNMLESDPQYAPDVSRKDLNTLPIRSGRAFYLRYQLEM